MFLPVNYRLAAPEAAYILGGAGAKLLLVDEEFDAIVALETPKIVIDAHAQADSRRLGQPAWRSRRRPPCGNRPGAP